VKEAYRLKLAEAASSASADPCDLCEEALPGYVLDELAAADRSWIIEHTRECNYCRGELESFERLDDLLDLCDAGEPAIESTCVKAAWSRIDSPIGPLDVAVSPSGVCEIGFGWMEDDNAFARRLIERGFMPVRDDARVEPVARELLSYLAGQRQDFGVPVDLSGVTPFSRAVLDATAAVPFGETRTYAQIANAIGKPGASRAVGNALNKNPVPLIVPCHRIVPTGGGIGNYAGTPQVKERLLSIEGALSSGNRLPGFL
jgi:O-6-methylguanine DNA methyltransferase